MDHNKKLCDYPEIPYYGIDREPYFISPNPDIRKALNLPLETNEKRALAISKWEYEIDRRGYIDTFEVARLLQEVFSSFNETISTIMCLVWLKGLMETLPIELLPSQQVPQGYIFYGFDVSWPVSSYHSGIFQPNFLKHNPAWLTKLNKYGLIANIEDAKNFRDSFVAWKQDGLSYEIIKIYGN